ncbi:nitroreductase family deazaflavin-dependent oxidoreductase [Amycolatopsis methanolica]|uniref:Cell entry (Mce) related family protein n=1 Tax=Amycolatopsis methanolica 239 TaxID=1068978 RepID=A0A076MU74_AMYME|nr:nitroreductase family deazaflavin-dependent oxidoreductase [Amycolatopsis methanolica]AIJ22446.1 cell entry (mce) related family protein [Amycolatopsis methanolica 239]
MAVGDADDAVQRRQARHPAWSLPIPASLQATAATPASSRAARWYHNLVANPKTTIELGDETFPVLARVLEGPERDEIYAKQSAAQPQFAEYQRKTSRVIPVIELVRV